MNLFRKIMARAKNDAGERIESLRFSVPALRVGVLEYGAGQLQTGNTELEGKAVKLYYPPEAVSDEKFLKSLETAPVVVGGHDSTTNEQNKKIDGWAHNVFFDSTLNAAMIQGVVKGAKEVAYIKGNLGTDGFGASAFVDIFNLKVENGVTPDGQEYNAIANELQATHVALAPRVRDPKNKLQVTNAVCVRNTGEMVEVENAIDEDYWYRETEKRTRELKSDDDRRGLTTWLRDWKNTPEKSSERKAAAKRIDAQLKEVANTTNTENDDMELSDAHIKALVKNMAEEMAREIRPTTAKNIRTAAEITWSNGDTTRTDVNGTEETVRSYYKIGQEFNIGSGGKDKMVKVKSVKILK
jgi:hypothetical protein